eukprot:2121801-Pleurochrysis_carterae.AAC.1
MLNTRIGVSKGSAPSVPDVTSNSQPSQSISSRTHGNGHSSAERTLRALISAWTMSNGRSA